MNRTKGTRSVATAVLWLTMTAAVYALGIVILYVSAAPDGLFWRITGSYTVFGVLCGLLAGRWASIPGMLLGSAAAYAILLFTEHDLVGWLAQGLVHGTEDHANVIFYVSATRQSMSILLFLLVALLATALVRWRHRQHT